MKTCLFCDSVGPFNSLEHVVPEALGNDNLILKGEVCDNCNSYFGAKIEAFVLEKTPLGFWRTILGIRKKRGKLPHINLSQPSKQKGKLPSLHCHHNNGIGFTAHDDYSVSVDISNNKIMREILEGHRSQFRFVFSPLVLSTMGRFLCKIGVEMVCIEDPQKARSGRFKQARQFARFGINNWLWPIFHFQSIYMKDLIRRHEDFEGVFEEVLCYNYRLLKVSQKYILLAFTVGTDTWVVSLNDPYATTEIKSAFPGQELQLIWYSLEEIK